MYQNLCTVWGEITRNGNFRYIYGLKTREFKKPWMFIYLNWNMYVYNCLGNQIHEFKNLQLCENKQNREN
jgi:hypothetical protein